MTLLLIAALLSQDASPSPAVETRTIAFSVVDDKGQPVRMLGPDDVAVQENGVARPLERLELDQRPLAVAVILDSSVTMAPHYRLYLVDAVLQFLLRLPEGTKYALWTTGDRPSKVLDWGDNRAAAAKALRRVIPQGGNTLLDALVEASRDLKDREGARSAMVVVTAMGIGFASYDRRQVVDELQKHPVTVLAVEVDEGRSPPALGASDHVTGVDYDYVLSTLAKSSGGARESTLSAMGIERALQGIAGQLGAQYRLTYASAAPARDAKVEVTVALPGVKVRMGGSRR
jgi:VWFA-related protein